MKKTAQLVFALQLIVFVSLGQPGSLDTTFGVHGDAHTEFGGRDEIEEALAFQPDGKVLVVGSSVSAGYGMPTFGVITVARYNTGSGVLDQSFGAGGKVALKFSDAFFYHGHAVALQNDGKIVVAGHRSDTATNTYSTFAIVRYNTDGSLNNMFGTYPGQGSSCAIQSDGKLLVAGTSDGKLAVLRYNTNDGLDATFGTGAVVTTDIPGSTATGNAIAIQPDEKIIVAGGNGDFILVRYNTDGTIDRSFGSYGVVSTDFGTSVDYARAMKIDFNGKILVAGETDGQIALARYNADGSLDNSFGSAGKVTTTNGSNHMSGNALAIQSDGRIIVAGRADLNNGSGGTGFALVRYSSNGAIDNTFGVNGISTYQFYMGDAALAVAIQNDGKILAAGYAGYTDGVHNVFTRFNNDSPLDVRKNLNEGESPIKVYPNPVNSRVNVQVGTLPVTNILVRDALGNCILSRKCRGENEFTLDLSAQPAGLYFIEVVAEDKKVVKKITLK